MSNKLNIKLRFFDSKIDKIDEVIELGDSNSKTLGHLPHAAFNEYAKKGGVIICKINNKLAGYCLFRKKISEHKIKIAQLCIANSYRGQGVADKILDFIKEEFCEHFRGVALNCRSDFRHATKVWERNYFFPEQEKRSRSKKENYLLQWYYSFNKDDLFTTTTHSRVKVLLDINIFIKLRDVNFDDESSHEEIKYLTNSDILTEVDYCYAKESLSELIRDKNIERRKRTRRVIKGFYEVPLEEKSFDSIYKEICRLSIPKNENDRSDRKQLATCIANNIPFFVTTDEALKKTCKKIEDNFNISILLPSEFIVKFDQIQNSASFLPRRIGGASFSIRKLKASDIGRIPELFFTPSVKGMKNFRQEFRSYCSTSSNEVKLITQEDKLLAMVAYHIKCEVCYIDFLRLGNISFKQILFNQLVTEVIRTTLPLGVREIQIPDNEIIKEFESSLLDFNFFCKKNKYKKIMLNNVYESNNLVNIPEVKKIINSKLEEDSISNEQKYELERCIFPGKIRDLKIRNIIIPIKPYWAGQLFDQHISSNSLFGSDEKLLWSRKNIYFRSLNPNIEKYPARILWYASNHPKLLRSKGIVACSYLDSVYIDKPKVLYSQFNKIGVYKWNNIIELAKNDPETKIKAIEFSDTEVFENLIPLEQVQKKLEKKHSFASPLEISEEQFFKIYSLKHLV